MNLIRLAIERPIAVVSAVIMVLMFGLLALKLIPIQLTPDIRKPVITVRTTWVGAAPAEIEREIVNRQEEVLRGLEGLDEMTSRSEDGRATITLEFAIDQNMDKALLLVSNRLDRVGGYPDEADEPALDTAGSEDRSIAWFILKRAPGNDRPMHTYGDFVEDTIKDRLERVPGVSRSNVYGGSETQMEVVVEPARMARYGLTVPQVVSALRDANSSVSAGDVEEGKRRYIVRTEGEFTSIDQVKAILLRTTEAPETGRVARVTVGDIAEVKFGYKDPTATIRNLGDVSMALNAKRETGANVIEVMKGLKEAVVELNETVLPRARLSLKQVYAETVYINSAIDLVKQNIYVGGTLAALVLLIFLRSGAATLIVSLAIPVSVVGSFVAMAAMGRSINVISLAGIAFAVGMVVDAAIVVLENIYRLRQEGRPVGQAAYEGAQQVWGAVLVSATTTVLVFAPILIMKLEIGQLFSDIAVAISVAVMLSLIVAITLIPALSNRLLRRAPAKAAARRIPGLDALARGFTEAVVAFARGVAHNKALAVAVVAIVCGLASAATYLFLPKLEYLPEGNRNLVLGVLLPPPGYNLKTTTDIAENVEKAVRPLWVSENGPDTGNGSPKIKNFFFVARRGTTFVGAIADDPRRAGELIPFITKPAFREPGTFGFVTQPSLFGRHIGGGRSVDLNISGPDLEVVLGVALKATAIIQQRLPLNQGHQFRPKPGLELGAPEVRIYPDPVRLADNGVTAREFSDTVDAFNDGLRVAEITVHGKRLDLMIKGPQSEITETQGIDNLPVVTRSGDILPVRSLAKVVVTSGPTEIRHLERERTVTLEVRPSQNLPLQAAMEILQTEVIDKLAAKGLPAGIKMRLAGTADKLVQTWDSMVVNLLLAVAIVYLVMAVLFESFVYPLIIILSVPLATAGGIGGLALVNLYYRQPLDMLTLLGFVILIGIVVNNAILLVHQTIYLARRENMKVEDAIVTATRNRIRPIFMSTLTSVFGMLPLVMFPGAGSELDRGLGSVVVGGLALSAVLTLLIIPPLLGLVAEAVERRRGPAPSALRGEAAE
ncbi:MAG: efflux RND transporter permease subunit [Rhodospirillales bacterium]|nr:efflux RND transporter permease subunit [Rhodospirillales bacterium]